MNNTKIGLDDLIEAKVNQDKAKNKNIFIVRYEKEIEITALPSREINKTINKHLKNHNLEIDYLNEIIYKSVTYLQSEEVQNHFAPPTPYEIVEKLFTFKEMTLISVEILELSGCDTENIESLIGKEIKN